MKSTIAAFTIAFIISGALTPVVRRIALAAGALDEAGGRRIHTGKIPRLGGLAVATAFFLPLVALFLLDSSLGRLFFQDPGRIVGLGLGAAIMLGLGAIDDTRGVAARPKLLVQSAAALVAWWGGYGIRAVALPFLGQFDLGFLSVIVTVLWFVGIINALNLIDGLDGLAAGIAFFACITNLVVGSVNDSLLVVLLSATLGGALLGFLIYNFNPASIFMGDSGSMFLGFILAASSLLGSTIKSSTTVAILVPVIALGVPITDTVWALARRLKQRRSIFSADRGHIHHLLLDLGLSQRRAVILLYGFSLVLTVIATGLALGRSLATGGALIIMAVMLIGVVRTAQAFTVNGMLKVRSHARLPLVEALRVQVPLVLHELREPVSVTATLSHLKAFAENLGIAECSVELADSATNISPSEMAPATRRSGSAADRRSLVYPLRELGVGSHIKFRLQNLRCDDQAQILLQLVADAVERCMLHTRAVERLPHANGIPASLSAREEESAFEAPGATVVGSA